MMTIIFGVAGGRIKLERVQSMLSKDNKEFWPNLNLSPPDGLTLANVEYDPEVLTEATDVMEELPVGPPPDLEMFPVQKIDW
jgi:tRNA U38,U39,U40 pseudouridine synthase TruA